MKVGEHEATMKLMVVDVFDTGIKSGKEKLVLFKL